MTPTLTGRLQTRVVLMVLVAVPLTLLLVPILGLPLVGALLTVLIMTALGVGWELVYHALQQLRWDKDWPSLFGLLSGVPEGLALWGVLGPLGLRPSSGHFAWHIGLIWALTWLIQQGPLKVIAPAWRFHGARLVERRPVPTLVPESPLDEMFEPEPVAQEPEPVIEPEPAPEPVHEPVREPARAGRSKVALAAMGAAGAGAVAWLGTHGPHLPKVSRPAMPAARKRSMHRPAFGAGARWAVLATAAVAIVGVLIGTNLGKDHHHAPAAAVHQPMTSPSTPAAKPTPAPKAPKPQAPQGSQPVAWQVPSDHKAFKTWNKNARVVPYALTIPRLKMQKTLGAVGLNDAGTMQTPKKTDEAAWYQSAAAPGQLGPGVLVGAMQGQKAIFAQLGDLVKGDTVLVTRMDSTTIQFKVDKVQKVPFDKFPSQSVYGMTDDPEVRLVGFAPAKGKTKGENVIVYGSAVQLLQPKQKS